MKRLFFVACAVCVGSLSASAQINPTWGSYFTDSQTSAAGSQYPIFMAMQGQTMAVAGFMNADLSIDGNHYLPRSSYADGFLAVYNDYTLQYVKKLGDTSGYDYATGAAISPSGEVYVVGRAGDFGNVRIMDGLSVPSIQGRNTAFVAKVDASGTPVWLQNFDGDDYQADVAESVSLSPTGTVTVTGHFEGDKVLIAGNEFTAPAMDKVADSRVAPANYAFSLNRDNVFVASFESDGTFRWGRAFGSETRDGTYGLATADDGTIYHAGFVTGDTDFGQGAVQTAGTYETYPAPDGSLRPIPNSDAYKGFLNSYGADGTLRWAKVFQSPGQSNLTRPLIASDGSIWVSVFFTESVDLDGDSTPEFASAPYPSGRRVLQFAADGTLMSSFRVPNGVYPTSVGERPSDGHIMLIGFHGPVDFDFDEVDDIENVDGYDLAVLDLSADQGTAMWTMPGAENQVFYGGQILDDGQVVGWGYTTGLVGMGSLPDLTAYGTEGFVIRFTLGDPDYATDAQSDLQLPSQVALDPAYPNPFNPITTIGYSLDRAQHIELAVFDLMGRRVQTLVDDVFPAGDHTARFDAGSLPSGMYLYRLKGDEQIRTGHAVLLK